MMTALMAVKINDDNGADPQSLGGAEEQKRRPPLTALIETDEPRTVRKIINNPVYSGTGPRN